VVLAVGRLAEQKGFGVLLAAAGDWQRRDPRPLVAIAGEGPLAGELAAAARRHGIDVRFLGARRDVPALLAAADLFLFGTQANEGMGLGLFEAMAAGLPVVATAVSDIAQLPPDTALLVPQGDPDALVDACRTLLADPADAAARAARGRRLVIEQFSVAHAVDVHVRRYLNPPAA
jgi:glycosyltransferase involved in cell wall biosynthesis